MKKFEIYIQQLPCIHSRFIEFSSQKIKHPLWLPETGTNSFDLTDVDIPKN